MSAISFAMFGIDKWKAVHQRWRIPESALIWSAALFGGIGGLSGMVVFHHKVRKWKFKILIPIFALIQVLLLGFILWTGTS